MSYLKNALVFGANYFSNIGTRFLIPPLPFVALAMTIALSAVPHLAIAIAVIHAVISWPALIPKYASRYSWHLTKIPWREALRIKPEGEYIASRIPNYAIDRLIEEKTPAGSTVFSFTPIPEAYTSRRIRVRRNSACSFDGVRPLCLQFDQGIFDWKMSFDILQYPKRP